MSPKDVKSVKHKTGADLRAQAEARLAAQAGPKLEATRRADVIRAGLTNYAATMDKIAEAYRHEDWRALGYESFNAYAGGEFGEARLKLTPEQRAQILPAFLAVGMSKRGAAAALGVDDKTIRNDLRGADNSAPKKKSPLVNAMRQAIEEAQTAAGGPSVALPADGSHDDGLTEAVREPASGPPPGPDATPNNSSPEASETSSPGEAPAGGDRNGHRAGADPAAIATTYRPGIDHPHPPVGEARAGAELLGAGVTPSSELGEGAGGDEVEDDPVPADGLSSTDPEDQDAASVFMRHVRAIGVALDQLDVQAVGPMLMQAEVDDAVSVARTFTDRVREIAIIATTP